MMMAIISPVVPIAAVASNEAGTARTWFIVVALIVWFTALLVMIGLAVRRAPQAPDDEHDTVDEHHTADELALDLDDPERTRRVADAERERYRVRMTHRAEENIGPYYLP